MISTVGEAWRLLQNRLEREGAEVRYIDSARAAFVAGVYASSKDVLMNRSDSQVLSEAADRIERLR